MQLLLLLLLRFFQMVMQVEKDLLNALLGLILIPILCASILWNRPKNAATTIAANYNSPSSSLFRDNLSLGPQQLLEKCFCFLFSLRFSLVPLLTGKMGNFCTDPVQNLPITAQKRCKSLRWSILWLTLDNELLQPRQRRRQGLTAKEGC